MKYRLGSTRQLFETDGFLGKGGEGTVVGIPSHPTLVAKIFATPTPHLRDKLQEMRLRPPTAARGILRHHRIAWPQELIFAERQELVVGYAMAKVSQAIPFASFCYPHLRGGGSTDRIFKVAIDICDTLASLHQDGYVVVDGNDANVLVAGERITWIDTDSFQIPAQSRIFTSAMAHPEFTPAESIGRRKDTILTPSHDLFALGVMMFKVFFEGRHPFMCRYVGNGQKPSLIERIQQGLWPHARTGCKQFLPPTGGRKFEDLHPHLRDAFIGCFEVGHRSPKHRPTAIEWRTTLEHVRANPFPARRKTCVSSLGSVAPSIRSWLSIVRNGKSTDHSRTGESLWDVTAWLLTAQLLVFAVTTIVLIIFALKMIQISAAFAVSSNDYVLTTLPSGIETVEANS